MAVAPVMPSTYSEKAPDVMVLPPSRDRIFWLTNFLYIFNVLLFIYALTSMGMSAWVLSSTAYLTALLTIEEVEMPSLLQQSAFVLLFVGIMLFVISIVGLAAIYTEQVKIIRGYGVMLLMVILLKLSIAVIIAVFKERLSVKLKVSLHKSLIERYYGFVNVSSKFTLSLDWAMVTFGCCGIDSFEDFQKATLWLEALKVAEKTYNVPKTCCKFKDKSNFPTAPDKLVLLDRKCPVYPTNENSWRSVGCYPKLFGYVKYYINHVIIFGASLLAFQAIGVFVSLFLAYFIVQRNQLYLDIAEGRVQEILPENVL